MLLQSQNGEIVLLPAQWAAGSVQRLRARGACTVYMDWKAGSLTRVAVQSDHGGTINIRYKGKTAQIKLKPKERVLMDGYLKTTKK